MIAPHNNNLHQMCLTHFNEPMLAHGALVRCIGYGETAVDCYIIAQKLHGEIVWLTCVGGYTFLDRLKGQGYVRSTGGEDWDDFTRLEGDLQLNGAPKQSQFLLELKHDDWEGRLPHHAKANEVIAHFDQLCVDDLIKIRRAITEYLAKCDKENGVTSWAADL